MSDDNVVTLVSTVRVVPCWKWVVRVTGLESSKTIGKKGYKFGYTFWRWCILAFSNRRQERRWRRRWWSLWRWRTITNERNDRFRSWKMAEGDFYLQASGRWIQCKDGSSNSDTTVARGSSSYRVIFFYYDPPFSCFSLARTYILTDSYISTRTRNPAKEIPLKFPSRWPVYRPW